MWAIPSGGIGAAIAWVANRKSRHAKTAKEVHDIYKAMYDDLGKELIKVRNNNDELSERLDTLTSESERTRRALNRLSRAIEAIQVCPHRANCPVSDQLSLDEGGGRKEQRVKRTDSRGQHAEAGKGSVAGKRESGHGDTDDSRGQP